MSGGRTTTSTPPYHFLFIDSKVQEISVDYPSFESALAAAVAKFGQPSSSGAGSGDITSLG
jgi:hypothetical protein